MKKTLLLISIFSLSCLSGCFSGNSPVNTAAKNSGASPLPSANVSTAPNTTNKVAVTDEYKDVQFPQCKIYLTTLKKLTTCKGLPEDQRKKMSDLYDKSLEQYKTSYSDADKTARELTISGCEMADKGMQPTLAKCN